MEGDGSTRHCVKVNSGIPHTILSKAPVNLSQCNQRPFSHPCLTRNDYNRAENEKTRHFKSSSSHTKLHITPISGAEIGRISPSNIQSQSAKRLCDSGTISFNKHVSYPGLSSAPRLAVQARYFPGLLSFENGRVTQALPTPGLQPRIVRNDVSSIRFKHCSENLLNSHKLGGSIIARKMECKNRSLSRRFFNSPPRYKHASRACPTNSSYVTNSGMEDKLRKICSKSSEEHCLFRNTLENLGQSKILAKRKICHNNRKSDPNSQPGINQSKRSTENSRATELCQLRCSSRSAPSSATVNVHEHSPRQIVDELPVTTGCLQRTKLVDTELSVVNTTSLSPSDKFSSNRRVGSGMGSTAERTGSYGQLVTRGTDIALQPKRNAGHIVCFIEPSSRTATQLNPHTMRQQDRSCSSTKRGRHEIFTPDEYNLSNLEPDGSTSNTLQHTPHPRQVQQRCRSFIAISPTPGVAPTSGLCRNSICQMGNPNNRSICLRGRACSLQLCESRPERPPSPVSRRVQHSMEFPARMGVSTTVSDPQSSDSLKSGNRNISTGSASVGKGILALGPQSPSSSSTADAEEAAETPNRYVNGSSTPAGQRHNARGLEMWGWSEAIKLWNPEQLSLLKNSWRKSTVKTYEVAWNRWTTWCISKNISTNNPTGAQLAQFLSDLHLVHHLSYSTILLHKSVVSTLCNTEASGHLSTHVLVKHILKSIALKNPKTSKPPVWDVSKLTSYLTNYTVDVTNNFQILRHTAILLLLCSGRRIHDLTLLTIDPSHCIRSDDNIIFWPRFGSKTDSSTYRQSGWKLLSNTNNSNLNPVFWIDKAIDLLKERRNSAKSLNLFVTIRGAAKPASRTIIAGWIKTLFKEAGITAAPGSVRSAVASKSWLENHSLDEILSRGNWRSANTFQTYYRREVIGNNSSETVTQLFKPIN